MEQTPKISVIIPCYYSEKSIGKAVHLARQELVRLGYDYEFVLVNDGSTDGTFREITALCEEDPKVKGVDLSRNFGQHSALMAALHYVTGDYVLSMDDDLQTIPPSSKSCWMPFSRAATMWCTAGTPRSTTTGSATWARHLSVGPCGY